MGYIVGKRPDCCEPLVPSGYAAVSFFFQPLKECKYTFSIHAHVDLRLLYVYVITRIKECGKYSYDADTDHFSKIVANTADDVFMDLDELCGRTALSAAHQAKLVTDPRPAAMERLVHELISDRLLILSRYITLDSSTRTILIDQTSLSADGYQVVTH